ncbi:MAG: hypothetical protein K0R84_1857 [Clostridia bacterium]|nr:hypothetical protein [Clostridia bacterium]
MDGTAAEKYSNIIAKLYLEDKYKFIKCLSALSEMEIESICSFTAYGCSYFDLEQIIKDTNNLMLTETLSEQEKTVIQKLIESFWKINS